MGTPDFDTPTPAAKESPTTNKRSGLSWSVEFFDDDENGCKIHEERAPFGVDLGVGLYSSSSTATATPLAGIKGRGASE